MHHAEPREHVQRANRSTVIRARTPSGYDQRGTRRHPAQVLIVLAAPYIYVVASVP
jgi:hypothetical protein